MLGIMGAGLALLLLALTACAAPVAELEPWAERAEDGVRSCIATFSTSAGRFHEKVAMQDLTPFRKVRNVAMQDLTPA